MTEDPEVPEEAASAAEIDLTEMDQEAEASMALEKCTKQCAQIVEKNAKYLSNQVQAQMEIHDQYIVEIATKTTKNSKT